jgi:hypothetical protein
MNDEIFNKVRDFLEILKNNHFFTEYCILLRDFSSPSRRQEGIVQSASILFGPQQRTQSEGGDSGHV